MEHDYVSDGLCDDRLLAESPAAPSRSSPSFSLPRRAREPVAVSTPTQLPIPVSQDRSGNSSQPTQPQTQALSALARFNPWKVIAWVEIVQSLKPGYQHNGGLAPLTPLELGAVHELKDCEKDWLLAWLKVAAQFRPWTSPSIKPRNRLTGICRANTTIINPTDLCLATYCKPSRLLNCPSAGILDAYSCLRLIPPSLICIQPPICSEHPP